MSSHPLTVLLISFADTCTLLRHTIKYPPTVPYWYIRILALVPGLIIIRGFWGLSHTNILRTKYLTKTKTNSKGVLLKGGSKRVRKRTRISHCMG